METLKSAARLVFMEKMGTALEQAGITDSGIRISSDEITAGAGVSPGPGGVVSTVFSAVESLLKTKLAQQPPGTQSIILTKEETLRALEPTIKTLADKTAGTVDKEIKSQIVDHVESPVALSPLENKQVKVIASRGLMLAKGILSDMGKKAMLPPPPGAGLWKRPIAPAPGAGLWKLPAPPRPIAPVAAPPVAAVAKNAAKVVGSVVKQAVENAGVPLAVAEKAKEAVATVVKQAVSATVAVAENAAKVAATAEKAGFWAKAVVKQAVSATWPAPSTATVEAAAEKAEIAAKTAVKQAAAIIVSAPSEMIVKLTAELHTAEGSLAKLVARISAERRPSVLSVLKGYMLAAEARIKVAATKLNAARAAASTGEMAGFGEIPTGFWAEAEFPLSGRLSETVKLAKGKVFTARLENELDKIATGVTAKVRNVSLYNILNKLEKHGYLSVTRKSPTSFEIKVLKFPPERAIGVPLFESLKASAAKEVKRRVENIARVKATRVFPVPANVEKLVGRFAAEHKAPPRVMSPIETASFTTYPETDWDFPSLGQEVEAGAEAFGQEVEAGAEAFGQEVDRGAEAFGQEVESGAEAFGQEVEAGAEAFGGIGIEEEPHVDGF